MPARKSRYISDLSENLAAWKSLTEQFPGQLLLGEQPGWPNAGSRANPSPGSPQPAGFNISLILFASASMAKGLVMISMLAAR